MRRTVALVSLILGLAALLAATAQLVFLAAGETTEARVAGVAYDDPETEIRYRRRGANTATGYFKLGIDVTYRFDVRPTPAEVLKRGSDEPRHKDVSGRDTLHWRSRDTDAEPVREGDAIPIRFLRAYPQWNRINRPATIRGDAITFGSIGGVLLVMGALLRKRNRNGAAK